MYTLLVVLCMTIVKIHAVEQCKTQRGEDGHCIPIKTCPVLLEALGTLNDTEIKYVQKSQCGYDQTPLVCCPAKNTNVVKKPNQHIPDLLSNKRYCGYQHFDDFATEKNRTSANLNEFPWLAGLLYDYSKSVNTIMCAGSLINNRYVLTAAHCTLAHDYNLVGVRLGEYDLQQNRDCADNLGFEDCSDPVAEFSIEKVIRHPEYSTRTKLNDIALIRLNQTVLYSDYIRPICLPFPGTKLANIGDVMTESGWGRSSYGGNPVNIKKKVLVELVSNDICAKQYSRSSRRFNITTRHTCTLPKKNTQVFSCQGDSGGPVMFVNKNQWHVEGIVSLGSLCGTQTPDVNTNVVSYLDWIVANVEP